MYWMVLLLIFLGITVFFVILQRYTQNKTLWITDMSAAIWFSLPSDQFDLVTELIEEYNQTLPKSTGVVVVGVNFETEDMLIERLEDSFYTFSTVQVPDMIFLSERVLDQLHKKKFVLSVDKDDPDFKMFPIMASVDMMHVNMKRFSSLKKYVQKNPDFGDINEDMLGTLEGLDTLANIYVRIQIEENLIKGDGVKPFITINSLNKFFTVIYTQYAGEFKSSNCNYDAFYKVWRFIVKGLLLGYITVIPEKRQFFNKMDTVKSPVAIGHFHKESYTMFEYPKFSDSECKVAPVTKYGMSFVTKRMHDAKKNVLAYFGDWFVQHSKNAELAVYSNCLPVVNGEVSISKEHINDAISLFAMDIDMEEEVVKRLAERSESMSALFTNSDYVLDDMNFDSEYIDKVVSKIIDYADACQVKLDDYIDYKKPDDDVVGTMYTRKAFDNWVNYFDL